MSLADDLQNLESHPQYLSATPEQRTGILDKWKDAAANNYSAGDPSLKSALADEAEDLLSANQARTRARLTPDITGKFPTIVPSWGEVLANPALAELPPEKKASISAKWRKDKSEQLLQMRPSEVEARAFLVDSHMADRTVAGEQPDVDALAGDLSDRLRNAVQVYAEKPVAKTGEFFRDADGFNVHPSAALGTWEEYAAKIDAQDATPEEKIKARAMYGVSRDAAINTVLKNTAAVEQATGPGPGIPVSLEDAPGGVPTGTKSVFKRPGKPDVPYEEFDQAAITQERIARYQSQGGSAEPLLSSDKDARAAAEKTLLTQLSQHVLPEIDPALAARVSANPESPEAQALVTGFRDNLRARLWVAPADVKDDFEKARVLTNGESVWNSGWVAQASPDEVKVAAASTGLKGDALKAAEERGLQQRIDAAQDIVDAIVTVKDGAMIEGPGFRPMPADFREYVAKRAGSDDYKTGKINAADILNEWKQKSGIVNAGINAASGAVPQFLQSINLAATGALTSTLQAMGADVPALSQWVDDNNTLLNEVQQLSAASETSRGQRIAGQIGKEVPFLLAGIGIGKLTEAGVRRGLTRAIASATAPEVLAAQGVAGVARSVALGERALASAAELANGTSSALRGYFGLQAARSGTDMYTGAYTKIKETALAQGYSEQSAQEMARSGAILPAIAGTAVTAGLMKLMPGGTEALVAKFGESATVAKLREKVGVDALKKMITSGSPVRAGILGAAKTVYTGFGKHALDEAVEEGVDEFLQSAIASGYDKTMTLPKMLEAAYDAALVGGIMGGASGVATNSFEGMQRVRAARQADIDSKREKVKRDARLNEVISRMEGNPESQAAVEELATEVAARKAALEEEAFQIQGFTRASEDDAATGQYVSEIFNTPEEANQFITEVSARIGAAPAKGKHPLALFEFRVAEPSPGQFQVVAAPTEAVPAADVEEKKVTTPDQDAKLAPLLADLETATSEFFADIRGVAATPEELAKRPSVARLREKYAAEIAAKSEKAEAILTRIEGLTKQISKGKTPLTSRGKKKATMETGEKEAPPPAAEEPDGLDISDEDKAVGLEETLTDYRGLREAIESSYVDPSSRPAVEGKEKDVSGQKQYEQNIRANRARFRKLADAERALRRIDASGEIDDTPERADANAAVAKAIESIKNTAKEKAIAGIPAVKAALEKLKSPGARATERAANRNLPPEYNKLPDGFDTALGERVRTLYKRLRAAANATVGDEARKAAKDRIQKLLDTPPVSGEPSPAFVGVLDEIKNSKQFKAANAADPTLGEDLAKVRAEFVPARPKAAKRVAPKPAATTEVDTEAPKPKGKPGRPKKEAVKGPVSSKLSGVSAVAAPEIVRNNVEEAIRTITDMAVEGQLPLETVKAIQKSRSGKRETVDDWWKLLTASEQAAVADALEISVVNAAPGRANRAVNAFIDATDKSKQKDPRIQAFLDFYKGKLGLSVDTKVTLADVSQTGSNYLEQQKKGPPITRKSVPDAIAAAQERVLDTQKTGALKDFIQTAVAKTEKSLTDAVELHMKLWSFARIYALHEASLAAPENADAKAGLDYIIDSIREAYSANNFKFDMTSDPQKFMDRVVSYVKGDFSLRFPGFSFLKADGARIAALDAAQNEVGSGTNNKIVQAAQRLLQERLSPEEKAEYARSQKEWDLVAAAANMRPESRPEAATAEPAATTAQTKRSTKEADKLGLKSGDVKSLRTALTNLASDTSQPEHLRKLAQFLADSNAVGAIRSFNIITDPDGPAGFFDPRTGEMSINLARPNTRGVSDVVAHELTHALADGYLSKKWPAGSPEAKIVDGLRATYEEARAAVQKLLKEKNLQTLRNDLLPKMAAQLTALTSLRKKRKALHKAKLRGASVVAAQYAPSLSQDEVDQMYFNLARETNGIHAFEEQIDDFAYALALDPVTGDPLMKGLAGQPFNNANGISTEFLTHALTDAKFQLLLNTLNRPAGADTFLTRAWASVEKMLRIKHTPAATRVDLMYNDLAELFGDTHVVDAMEAPSAPPVILGPIMAPFRTSAENIAAAIRPWATKAGIGVLAPIEVEVLPADYSPATAPDSETKPENTNESETSTSEETPAIPPGPERQEGSDGQEGLLTAPGTDARSMLRASDRLNAVYRAAVESGDMEKAQRMVNEVASAMGYTSERWHGTRNNWTVWDSVLAGGLINLGMTEEVAQRYATGGGGGRGGMSLENAYFETDDARYEFAEGELRKVDGDKRAPETLTVEQAEALAQQWEGGLVPKVSYVMRMFVRARNLLDLTSSEGEAVLRSVTEAIDFPKTPAARMLKAEVNRRPSALDDPKRAAGSYWAITKQEYVYGVFRDYVVPALKKQGYDGIRLSDDSHKTEAVFDANQIKSADAATYNENGDLIDLFDRFNTANDDIRYSRAASPIVTGENGVANLAVPADMLRRMSEGSVTDEDNVLLDEAAQEIAAFREHAFWSLEPYGRVNSRAAAPVDAEYMAAVGSGDTTKAKQLVDTAAKAAAEQEIASSSKWTAEMFDNTPSILARMYNKVWTAADPMARTTEYLSDVEDLVREKLGIDVSLQDAPLPDARMRVSRIREISPELAEWADLWNALRTTSGMTAVATGSTTVDVVGTEPEDSFLDLMAGFRNSAREALKEQSRLIETLKKKTGGLYSDAEIITLAEQIGTGLRDAVFSYPWSETADQRYARLYEWMNGMAPAVTYDENGSVIPLSARFSPDSADIRYSRAAKPIDTFTLTDAPDWVIKTLTSGGLYAGLDKTALESILKFGHEQLKTQPKAWANAASTRERTAMTWHYNKVAKKLIARNKPSEQSELAFAQSMLRRLNGTDNYSGKQPGEIYGMTTSFSPTDARLLDVLADAGIRKRSRVAGVDAVFTPAAQRVDADFYELTTLMQAVIDTSVTTPANPESTMWMVAQSSDSAFPKLAQRLKQFGYSDAAVEALTNFRNKIKSRYPTVSATALGNMTGMTQLMDDVSRLQTLHRGLAILPPDKQIKRLTEIYDIVAQHGSWIKPMDLAKNKDADSVVLAMGGDAAQQRAAAMQERFLGILGRAAKLVPDSAPLKFLGAGSEAFSFLDKSQGLVYKLMFPRFMSDSVGFGLDMGAVPGKNRRALFDVYHENPLGRSPLRSMLLEEHTQVPGLVDHEIVAMTESGALLAVQRAVEGDIYEEDSQQAIFDEWQIQHGAAEFDASSMNAQLLPASLTSAVLTKDALGNYRAVFDIRSANVNVENNAFLPYDALVTPPLPEEVLQSKIIEDAKDEVDQRVHSRASSSVVESGMRVLLRMRKGAFALKQPSSRPNDVLNTVWGPMKNLTRYGGFGKLAHPTVMELRAKEQESLLLASRTLEAVERAIKRSTDPETVRELANAVIGSQDNLYDVPMHDAAMKTWRKARADVLKEWTKAQRQAEAVGKTTKAGAQILQDAGTKLMADMDAANTARDAALDDAAQAGAENYAGYQETAKRELNSIDPEVAKAVDKMRRTIDQFSHQLDKAGAITGRLKSVVSRNMGIYLTRTYQIHDDPAYLDLLMSSDPEMQSRMQQAEQYFRDRRHAQYVAVYKSKNPGASDTLANNFADRRMAASGAEMAAQDLREFLQYHYRMTRGAASTGTLNESILLEKTDLPSPLRALLGQQTNNIAAGAVSIMELGRYDANWEFLTNIHSLLSEAELARINRREELRLREASFTAEERKEFDDLGNVMYFTNNKVEAARHGLELFIPPRKNMAKSTLGPLDGFYGPPALVQAMQDLTPPDRGVITQMLAQFTGIAQANLTVYSWRSQIRNIASNMAMPLAAGHLPVMPPIPGRGFADRWIGKMGRVDDLLSKAADRDEAMTDLVAFYARYGVTGGNASQQVQQDVAKIAGQDYGAAMINVYPAAVARGTLKAVQTFGRAAGKASEILQNMYAFGDDIYKIMLFERELAAYIDSFGIVVDDAGGFTLTDAQATEIIDAFGANGRVTPVMRKQIGSSRAALAKEMLLRESAAAVRDSIAYYDTMPELINKFRRSAGIVAAPFLSFRVAMPMAMLGSFRRARFDMQNPITRNKGRARLFAMAAGFGAYTWALKTILKGLYLAASAVGGGDDDKRKVAAFDFPLYWANKEEFALRHLLGDYYRNRDIAYLGINSNGDPIYVDLSWLNPTSQIRDLIVPIMNPSAWREGQTGPAFRESLSRLAEPFITPQILVDAFAKTSMKDDLEASFDTKLEAFGKGVLSAVGMALTPGTVSDVVKTGKAIGTQRQNEEIISSVFGIKVKTVDVAEQLNRDLKAGAQMNIDAAKSVRALKNKDIPPDVQDAYDETMALRARVFQQMSDKYQAASLFIGPDAALKVLRKGDHGLGGTSIKDIERGTLSPYKPSEVTLDAMRRMDRKHGTDRTEKVLEAIRKQESKPLMPL